jgi:dipeptidyl aminopeptidase/acylaminoacyl peptidase
LTFRAARTLALCAAATLAAATVCAPAGAAGRPMQLSDLRRVVSLSSPAISPDGKRAVFIVSKIDWGKDRTQRELELIDLTTHVHRTLTYGRKGLSDPAWSNDGTRLAFIALDGSDDDAKPQIFVMPLDGGDARPATHAAGGVDQFAWRPDGGAFAYASSDPEPKHAGAAAARDAFVFTTEPITSRGVPQPAHLFVVPVGGGKAKQLTTGAESVATGEAQSTLSWSADGSTLAFTLAPNAILNDADREHVETVDVATGRRQRLTTHAGFEADPHYSPDGKHIVYVHSAGDNQVNLSEAFVSAPGAGEGTALSRPFDRAVHDVTWLPDSSGILFAAADATSIALVRAPLAGPLARIDLGDLVLGSSLERAVGPDGSLVFVASSTHVPAELYYKTAGGVPVKLTDYNAWAAELGLGDSERITFPTSLGLPGDGVLLTPPGYTAGKKYPLVLAIHGGPTSASVRGFDRFAQLLAARGWLVLEPNYRGSDNLGLAYQRAVLYDPDEGPGKDIMAAVDALRARGIVDERRIAVSGWSYGGIMTAWMISRYHIWSAAVSGASVDDWITDYGVADDSDSDRTLFHGSPFVGGNAAEYRKASAISYVRDVTTPLLIISDVGDNRDPFATSSMYYRALRDNGKTVTFVAYPVDGHFPGDPVRQADVYARWIEYIAQHFR